MPTDIITNGFFNGLVDGWTYEGPSLATVQDLSPYEGMYCAYIYYDRECAMERGTRINQTITIPDVPGDIFLDFWERTFLANYAGDAGIKFDDVWIWRVLAQVPSRRSYTSPWAHQNVIINQYKGKTVQLAITWHDANASACMNGDHIGWIRVDNMNIVLPGDITYSINISSNPPSAIIKVDDQLI